MSEEVSNFLFLNAHGNLILITIGLLVLLYFLKTYKDRDLNNGVVNTSIGTFIIGLFLIIFGAYLLFTKNW